MTPADKKLEKDVKEGKIPKPIEDLPTEWAKEDREIEGGKPDLSSRASSTDYYCCPDRALDCSRRVFGATLSPLVSVP